MRAQEQLNANARLRQRNLFLAGAFVLALVAVGAAVFFLTQSNEQRDAANQANAASQAANATAQAEAKRADDQAKISDSRALAAQSISKHDEDLPLSYLLGIAAFKKSDTAEARTNLFNLRYEDSHPRTFLRAEYAQYIKRDAAAYDNEYAKNPTCSDLPIEPLVTPTPSPTP